MQKFELNLHDVATITASPQTGHYGQWVTFTLFDKDDWILGEVNVWGPVVGGKPVAPELIIKKPE